MRFARNVHFQIKSGKHDDFKKVLTGEVLPLLKSQKGFREEVMLLERDRGMAISLWEDRPSAEAYQTTTYPQVMQKLSPMLEGTPKVETYDVAATTLRS